MAAYLWVGLLVSIWFPFPVRGGECSSVKGRVCAKAGCCGLQRCRPSAELDQSPCEPGTSTPTTTPTPEASRTRCPPPPGLSGPCPGEADLCQGMGHSGSGICDHSSCLVRAGRGSIPVIITAPHGGTCRVNSSLQIRSNSTIPDFNIVSDYKTHELAGLAVDKLQHMSEPDTDGNIGPYYVIALFTRQDVDANRPRSSGVENEQSGKAHDRYHQLLREYVDEVRARWGEALLVDIHGQGHASTTIYRGTRNLETNQDFIARVGEAEFVDSPDGLMGILKAGATVDPSQVGDLETRYIGGHTVKTYGSHNPDGVDAVQLEYGYDLRTPFANRQASAELIATAIYSHALHFNTTLVP